MKPNESSPARLWALRTIMTLIVALIISVIAATIVGFWLSYAGLHAFAFRAGLRGPEAWAWPASVDLFILAGELGVTISAVRGKTDKIAWAYLIGGALLSVLFNIVHVWLHPVWWGRYAVAAVPPVAAMLALAALLRQVVKGVSASGNTVSSRGPTTVEGLAEKVLRETWEAGNALNQNQLETRFGLTRAEAKKLRERVIPQTPAPAASDPSTFPPGDGQPPGPVTIASNGASHG